jgi:hypothetical protein
VALQPERSSLAPTKPNNSILQIGALIRVKHAVIAGCGGQAITFAPSMANKVRDDHPDDDGERGGENDTESSSPHAFCGIIKAIKFAQHYDIKAL